MVFSSLIFIFVFLTALLVLYYVLPKAFRNAILIIFSLFFYAWGEPVFVVAMIIVTVFVYLFALMNDRAHNKGKNGKLWLILSLLLNLGMLGFFKYSNFLIDNFNTIFGVGIKSVNVVMPIGISFYTFQILSYSIDVYRKKVDVQKNFFDLLLYATLFPQLVAGPIVRYSTVAHEIKNRTINFDMFCDGFIRFVVGLGKKILVANRLASVADYVFGQPVNKNAVFTAWLGIIAYTLQIYFDFSGYSDMAIGLGKMFGFNFDENFDYPYISNSISEFWRRWHISLGSWFRDYLYFPMGGSRVNKARLVFNLFVVWTLTGLWHGASWNFAAWGAYFFVFITLEKLFRLDNKNRKYSFVKNALTMLVVTIGWVLFRADSLSYAFEFIKRLFSFTSGNLIDYNTKYYLFQKFDSYIVGIVCALPILPQIKNLSLRTHSKAVKTFIGIFELVAVLAILSLSIICLVNESYNPFIYFRF